MEPFATVIFLVLGGLFLLARHESKEPRSAPQRRPDSWWADNTTQAHNEMMQIEGMMDRVMDSYFAVYQPHRSGLVTGNPLPEATRYFQDKKRNGARAMDAASAMADFKKQVIEPRIMAIQNKHGVDLGASKRWRQ